MTSWQQVKQQAVTTATSKPASIYFPTKAFVKASSTPQGKMYSLVVQSVESQSSFGQILRTQNS